MNRTLLFTTALAAGLAAAPASSQTAAAPAPSAGTAATTAAVAPQALPAKVALIAFEPAVLATNEGQVAVQGVQKKYEPKKSQLDALSGEIEALKKQAQSAPATQSDDERQARLRSIDTKEKQLARDGEDATNAYQADVSEAYGRVAQKFSVTMKNYCQQNGFTLLLDVSNQASPVMWALQSTDITQAAVDAYNKSSGVAAPPPSAPGASAPARSTTPRPSTTPRR